MLYLVIFLIVAYALGSLSSAVLVSKAMGLQDPRTAGSKNPGATNMLRLNGKQAALLTLSGDVLKGFLPVILAKIVGLDGFLLSAIALAAFLGHLFPIFFNFKGGKGVATALGAILGLSFFVGGVAMAAWIVTVVISRYASLAAMVAMLLAILLVLFVQPTYFFAMAVMAGMIVWKHWDNIQRLKAGEEPKMDLKL